MMISYPKVIDDIEFLTVTPLFRKRKTQYLIGSRKRDRVLSTKSEQAATDTYSICQMMDGNNSYDDIRNLAVEQGIESNLEGILSKLDKAGLLETSELSVNNELNILAKTIVSLKMDNKNKHVIRICRFLVTAFPYIILALLSSIAVLSVLSPWNPFSVSYSVAELIVSSILMYFFIMLHEIGHLIIAYATEVTVESLNISLRWYVMPIIYIKYKWINFEEPINKAKVLVGGLSMNLFCALSAMLLYLLTSYNILLLLSIYNFGMILASLYPQTLSDGYFLFLLVTNKSNIRLEAIKWIFSSKKDKPQPLTITFIGMYIFVSVSGLISTYFIFGQTVKNFCNRIGLNADIIMVMYFVLYIALIVKTFSQARKIIG